MRPDDRRYPYGPRMVFGDQRTTSIEDLDETQLAFLEQIYSSISVVDLRARVADVLFVRKRHNDHGRAAIDAYLESASVMLSTPDWMWASHSLERALALSASVKTERDRVVHSISTEIESRRRDSTHFSARMMHALLDARVGEPAIMSTLAEQAAEAVVDDDWHREREYLLLAAEWSRKGGKLADERRLRLAAAESHVKLADSSGSRSLEATHLERAIQALRTLPGTQHRTEELHRRMLAAEKEVPAEFRDFSQSMNIAGSVQKAREHVAGKPLPEAILRLALMWRPETISRLREAVLSTIHDAPFFNAVTRVLVNRQGKVVARRGSLLAGDGESREEAFRQQMFERAAQQREMIAVGTLKPARAQIVDEHYVGVRDLLPLTTRSAFVPPGQEEVFAVGLASGFNGDFAGALHLLIPQVENSVRMILAQNGAITSRIDDDGVQDERSLNELLDCEQAPKVFGDDLLFDLRGLLIERFGGNLRNRVAHGLLDATEMTGPQSVYFWWLTLYLVIRPLLQEAQPLPDVPGDEPRDKETAE